MSHHTSITDKPITSVDQDKLKSKRYALALTEFISHSDTPMTVGLQGEWGTGKTSMMYMLREQLKAKKLIIKGHVYHPVGAPAPEGNPHIEFKEGGKSIPDQWSFTLYSADGLPRLREVIANRIDELS